MFRFLRYFEFGAVAVVLAWAYFTVERHGEMKIRAAVEVAAKKQKDEDAKEISDAQQALTQLQAQYDTAVHTVPVAPPSLHVRVCDDAPVRPRGASKDAGAGPRGDEAVRPGGGVVESPGPAHDVTQVTLRVLADAGARINYLQGYIKTCQDQGFCDAGPSR